MNIYTNIIIVCNPNYHYAANPDLLLFPHEFNGYTLLYTLYATPESNLFQIKGYGQIEGARDTVYIMFTQISEREDDETFFAFIQNTIRKK